MLTKTEVGPVHHFVSIYMHTKVIFGVSIETIWCAGHTSVFTGIHIEYCSNMNPLVCAASNGKDETVKYLLDLNDQLIKSSKVSAHARNVVVQSLSNNIIMS